MDSFKHLCDRKMYADALVMAEERLKLLRMGDAADHLPDDVRRAMELTSELKTALPDLEIKFLELSAILDQLASPVDPVNAERIDTLSRWLENIRRIKN